MNNMKKNKILKSLFVSFPIATPLAFVYLSSCSSNSYLGSVDGVTWSGRTEGSFQSNDYVVDMESKTITYTNGIGLYATNLIIPDFVVYHFTKLKVFLGKGCFLNNIHIIDSITLTLSKSVDNFFTLCSFLSSLSTNIET